MLRAKRVYVLIREIIIMTLLGKSLFAEIKRLK